MNNMPFVAGERVSDSRRDDESMLDIGEEEQQRSRAVAPATRRAEVTLADLFVVCRRRCHRIASSSLRDLGSNLPPQMTCYSWDRTLSSVESNRSRNGWPQLGPGPGALEGRRGRQHRFLIPSGSDDVQTYGQGSW